MLRVRVAEWPLSPTKRLQIVWCPCRHLILARRVVKC